MLVYFHIDEVSRDAIVASALRKELKKVGGKLIYGSRQTASLLRNFNIFDVVILPSITHYIATFPDPDELPDNIVILPAETVGQATGHLRRINAKYFGDDSEYSTPWHQSVAKYLLWGFDHIKPFQEYYPSYIDKCIVVGHPRLADVCLPPAKRKIGNKPVVGFVTRWSMLNAFDGRSIFSSIYMSMKVKEKTQPKFENSDNRDSEDLMYTEAVDFRVLLKVIKALDPDKYTLSIRIHPRENRGQWSRFIKKHGLNVVLAKWDDPFTLWMNDVDIIVSPPSTCFYEILSQNMHPICTRDVIPHRANHVLTESDDNNQILNFVYCPESVDEIVEAINSRKIPDMSEGVSEILEGQTGLSIAKNAITNIALALRNLTKNKQLATTGLRRLLPLAIVAVVIISHLKYWKNRLLGDGEQGSVFWFTLGRLKMINQLTRTIKK